MPDIFKEILPSILHTKESIINEENEKEYVGRVINKALSYHYDTALYANIMNVYPDLDPLLQYHYLINIVRGYKRPFRPWHKRTTTEDLEAVKAYYGFSYEKAREALPLLTQAQVDLIKEKMTMGGINAKPRRINRNNSSTA